MEETVILEWSYNPVNFFEEPITITEASYELHIEQGKVEAKVKAEYFDNHPGLIEQLETILKSKFMGVQLIDMKLYTLSKPAEIRIMPDGIKINHLIAEGLITGRGSMAGRVDFIVKDNKGNITADTKRDRINYEYRLADLINKYISSNPLVNKLIISYETALKEPNNSLIHLYEIREALSEEFGTDEKAKRSLNIDKHKWSRFGNLANHEPIKQGRHRGEHLILRDATAGELQEAYSFALSLIEGYLHYLEAHHQ